MASVPAVFTLIANRIEQEVAAERAQHDLIKLFLDELVAVHLMDFALAFPDSTLSPETAEWGV